MKNLVIAGITIAVIVVAVSMWTLGPGVLQGSALPSEAHRAQYRTVCEPILEWIENRKAAIGRYPKALPAEHIAIIENLDPLSSYRVFDRGGNFELSIGDYTKNHEWVYYYSSKTHEWYADQ